MRAVLADLSTPRYVWTAAAGRIKLPPAGDMRRWIAEDQRAMSKRYVRSERHTMQVDYWRYIRTMKKARKKVGAR